MAKKKIYTDAAIDTLSQADGLFFGLSLNEGQQAFKDAIMSGQNQVVMCNAVAGAGKTLLAVACAKLLCAYGKYESAVYVFPTVEEGTLGYRPGDTTSKEADYTGPLLDALYRIGERPTTAIASDSSLKLGTAWIEARSATFMRGINLEHKVVIIDECQNMTIPLLKRIISRCHDDCLVICLGCTAQMDIPAHQSGFKTLLEYLAQFDKVTVCELPVSYRGWLAKAIDGLS
nr:MAG TPA: PhoH-like protein [Caudoviricetes sp.]